MTPPGTATIPANPARRDRIIMAALVILTAAAFVNALNGDFLNYDDPTYVTENPRVLDGLSLPNVAWAFTTGTAANYHPLTWLSLMLDSSLWGNQAMGYHATNLALHLVNVVLVFLALRALTRSSWRSALVAALFALHPLRAESVAWVSERKDVLSACLGLCTLLAYARYARSRDWRAYLLVVACFVLSLLAKPMLVTLPLVLLLLDYWPLGRSGLPTNLLMWKKPAGDQQATGTRPTNTRRPGSVMGSVILDKLPLLVLSAASCIVTVVVQLHGGAVRTTDEISITARLANIPVAYARYLGKMVWFSGLAVDYPYPHTPNHIWPLWVVGGSLLILMAATAVVIWRGRANPWLAVGWFWYLGMLVPVIGLVQVGNQSMADRYTYLPCIGLLIMLAWSLPASLLERQGPRVIGTLGLAVVLAALCRATQVQVGYWQSSVSLFDHATRVTRDNYLAENNLGSALASLGEVHGAVQHYAEAARIRSRSAEAHNSLGLILSVDGQDGRAAGEFRLAQRLDPKLPEAYNNLGLILERAGDKAGAARQYRRALQLRPDYADAHNNLGLLLANTGDPAGAITQYELALKAKPEFAEAQFNMGLVLQNTGRLNAAIPHFQEAVRLKPLVPAFAAALEHALARQNQNAKGR